jgi:hypothetical protein
MFSKKQCFKTSILGLCAFSLMGCAIGSDDPYSITAGDSYNLYIDPAFTPAQTEYVIAAANDWIAKVPDLSIAISIAACSGVKDKTICIHPSTEAQVDAIGNGNDELGYTSRWQVVENGNPIYYVDGGEIFLSLDLIQSRQIYQNSLGPVYITTLQSVAEHEIGHAMGLLHLPGTGILMNAYYVDDCNAATCSDIAEWYNVRGQAAPSCSIPVCAPNN